MTKYRLTLEELTSRQTIVIVADSPKEVGCITDSYLGKCRVIAVREV